MVTAHDEPGVFRQQLSFPTALHHLVCGWIREATVAPEFVPAAGIEARIPAALTLLQFVSQFATQVVVSDIDG
jgi:hypothetical protein